MTVRLQLAVFLIVGCFLQLAPAQSVAEKWIEDAASAYRSGLDTTDRADRIRKFQQAESLFSQAIEQLSSEQGIENAELYVNLGNAALAAEHIGGAIVAYHRALKVDSSHRRARQNLEHARTLIPDWIPKPAGAISFGSIFDWVRGLESSQWSGIATAMFLVSSVLFAVFLRFESRTARHFAVAAIGIWLIVLIGVSLATRKTESEIAVVIVDETIARSADSIHAPARLPEPLPSGAEVEIVDRRDQWIRVRMFDGREVWLSASAVEIV